MTQFRFTRIYSSSDGESHFEDTDISFPEGASTSDFMQLLGWRIITVKPNSWTRFHCSSNRQYVVNIQGEVEIETSDGDIRSFGEGEMVLFEDVFGKGHRSRAVGEKERIAFALRLPQVEP